MGLFGNKNRENRYVRPMRVPAQPMPRPKAQKTAFAIAVPLDEHTGEVKIGCQEDIHIGQAAYLLLPDGNIMRTSPVQGIRRDQNLVIITGNSEYRIICESARMF